MVQIPLSPDQCLVALAGDHWARVATTRDALPCIEVARSHLDGDVVLLRPAAVEWRAGSAPAGVVAVEVGACADPGARWSVMLLGEVEPAHPERPDPTSPAGPTPDVAVRVLPASLTGWMLTAPPSAG